MKKDQRASILIFILILLFLVGCAPQSQTGLPAVDLNATAEEIVRQTQSVPPTVPPINTLTPVPTVIRNTPTPTPTSTAIVTPTPTYTATPIAVVHMTGDTNCRQGPSTHYGFVTLLQAGQTADIVGKDKTGDYWVVNNPNGEGTCWIWNAFATATGSLDRISVKNAPPTLAPTREPTSTPRLLASVRYYRMITCDETTAIVIRIYNYSRREFDSWRAQVFESPDRTFQVEVASDQFAHTYDTCKETLNIIEYRNTGYAIIPFDATAASRFLIEFDVCAYEGRDRDCLFNGIYVNSPYFTPTPTPTLTPTNTP